MKKNQIRKRVAALALASVMALSLFGCGSKSASSTAGVSGEFTGTAKGMGGDVTVTLTLTDAAIDKIANAGFDPVYGARPLKRYMQSHLETMLAKAIIAGDVLPGQNVTVDVNADGELEVRK